jgi:uroporphyrinogen III methyltransferase/synthase
MTEGRKPLAGKCVVVTRASEQAGDFTAQLAGLGAAVLHLPTVAFADPTEFVLLDAALRALDRIDWIVFTSENAVKFLKRRADTLGIDTSGVDPRPAVAAVGPATAQAALAAGFGADYVAKKHSGAGLAAEMQTQLTGRRVLLPRSDLAQGDLPRALREVAAQVIEVVAYRTVAPGVGTSVPSGRIRGDEDSGAASGDAMGRIRRGDVDVITFASPSAFHHFRELIDAETMQSFAARVSFAAIGPTTARAIREAGWLAPIEAAESTAQGFAEAIAAHFDRASSGVKSS